MEKIELVKFTDKEENYTLLHKWCSHKDVYEWFEQRILSYPEIVQKYQNKLKDNNQKLFMIKYNDSYIGLVQIYRYDGIVSEIEGNIYEYDLFIGEEKFLSKGIGSKVVGIVNKFIYDNYQAEAIVLRPFKRNLRALKCYLKNNFHIVKEYQDIDTIGNKEEYVLLINQRG